MQRLQQAEAMGCSRTQRTSISNPAGRPRLKQRVTERARDTEESSESKRLLLGLGKSQSSEVSLQSLSKGLLTAQELGHPVKLVRAKFRTDAREFLLTHGVIHPKGWLP